MRGIPQPMDDMPYHILVRQSGDLARDHRLERQRVVGVGLQSKLVISNLEKQVKQSLVSF
jgi:hypothetical protein